MINKYEKAILDMADIIIKDAKVFSEREIEVLKEASKILKDEECEKSIQESLSSCRRIIDSYIND